MGRRKKNVAADQGVEKVTQSLDEQKDKAQTTNKIRLGELLSETKQNLSQFDQWLIGTTPLIVHAWSHKAKLEMLKKQAGATRLAKEARDPEQDFKDSLYEIEDGVFGFPVTALKNALISNAHVDRGVAKTDLMGALWLDAEIVQTRPALAGARCDLPLIRIYGSPPEMREDMVRIGTGPRRTANLAYRGQFSLWAVKISGLLNEDLVQGHQLAFLLRQAGIATGIGDWRNEKKGWFGAFRIASPAESEAWDAFSAGKGPLPTPKEARAAVGGRRNGKRKAA